VFGLGGCAVLAKDYFRFLDDPWRYMKEIYFDGAEQKMHASELKKPTIEQLNALKYFFSKFPFFRFAVMAAETLKNQTIELKHFSAYRIGNGEIEIQPKVLLASKKVRATCVEVADFVIHPAGAQVRNRLLGFKHMNNIIRKDFDAVFHNIDSKLVSYTELLSAKPKNV
jgi:hypothetical protein